MKPVQYAMAILSGVLLGCTEPRQTCKDAVEHAVSLTTRHHAQDRHLRDRPGLAEELLAHQRAALQRSIGAACASNPAVADCIVRLDDATELATCQR